MNNQKIQRAARIGGVRRKKPIKKTTAKEKELLFNKKLQAQFKKRLFPVREVAVAAFESEQDIKFIENVDIRAIVDKKGGCIAYVIKGSVMPVKKEDLLSKKKIPVSSEEKYAQDENKVEERLNGDTNFEDIIKETEEIKKDENSNDVKEKKNIVKECENPDDANKAKDNFVKEEENHVKNGEIEESKYNEIRDLKKIVYEQDVKKIIHGDRNILSQNQSTNVTKKDIAITNNKSEDKKVSEDELIRRVIDEVD